MATEPDAVSFFLGFTHGFEGSFRSETHRACGAPVADRLESECVGDSPQFDTMLRKAGPGAGLGARQSLAALQSKLFGQVAKPVTVGRFELGGPIGSGGGGAVYRGRDPRADKPVAIKLLHAGQEYEGAPSRDRLLREAQALANLRHPNVVEVLDVGEYVPSELHLELPAGSPENGVFVAMEYIEGSSLASWLKARPRSLPEVREIFMQAGRGLAAAHQHGIVHRDFKPANVIVGDDGRVVLVDFGLARAIEKAPESLPPGEDQQKLIDQAQGLSEARLDQSLTKTGTQVGTPVYMAPEQHQGRRGDARSDQYAFCVSMYEGIFEHPPFVAISDAEMLQAKLRKEIIEGDLAVPKRLRALLHKGLDPDPTGRFANMNELLDELEASSRIEIWKYVAAIGALVLAGAAAYSVFSG
jgi:serine/threonine protein kinase